MNIRQTITSGNQLVRNQRLLNDFFRHLKHFNETEASTTSCSKSVSKRNKIKLRMAGRLRVIYLEDVIYFKSEDKYTVVKHKGGVALIDESLKSLEKETGNQFIRIHRNALVARNKIMGYDKTNKSHLMIVLDKVDEQLLVSRRNESEVRKLFRSNEGFITH